jgi:mono/diheme cytochrome c family protein
MDRLVQRSTIRVALASISLLAGCGMNRFPAADSGTLPLAEQGRLHVAQRKCGACHTESGDPDAGTLAGRLTPYPDPNYPDAVVYPANLTPDPDTGIESWSDDDLGRALRTGVDDEGAELCPTMPRQADMTDDEVKAIIAYLRSLPPVHREVPESTCPPLKVLRGGVAR